MFRCRMGFSPRRSARRTVLITGIVSKPGASEKCDFRFAVMKDEYRLRITEIVARRIERAWYSERVGCSAFGRFFVYGAGAKEMSKVLSTAVWVVAVLAGILATASWAYFIWSFDWG